MIATRVPVASERWLRRALCVLAAAAAAPAAAAAAPPARHATLPCPSPDGARIVYCTQVDSADTELEVVTLATGRVRRITRGGGDKHAPGWSGDGRRVTWVASRGDTAELWSMALEGGGARRVAALAARSLALAHDGRRVAYAAGSWTRSRLWVGDTRATATRALTDSSAGWFNLAWSPDDRTLAATRMDSTGALEIRLVPLDGSPSRPLVRLDASEGRPQWPAWSPDGRRIAFQAGRDDRADPSRSEAWVCVVDAGGGPVKRLRLHPGPMLDEAPSWLGNDRLAFQSTQSGRFEVWVMDADGMRARRVTR